jgi:hypothetical protein
MFIESEVTLLHVNNVNITDPHFNMPGQCQNEHHKIVILSVLVEISGIFRLIPMEMKGFRNDTGQIACTLFVPRGYEPGCKSRKRKKIPDFSHSFPESGPVSSLIAGIYVFFHCLYVSMHVICPAIDHV